MFRGCNVFLRFLEGFEPLLRSRFWRWEAPSQIAKEKNLGQVQTTTNSGCHRRFLWRESNYEWDGAVTFFCQQFWGLFLEFICLL